MHKIDGLELISAESKLTFPISQLTDVKKKITIILHIETRSRAASKTTWKFAWKSSFF